MGYVIITYICFMYSWTYCRVGLGFCLHGTAHDVCTKLRTVVTIILKQCDSHRSVILDGLSLHKTLIFSSFSYCACILGAYNIQCLSFACHIQMGNLIVTYICSTSPLAFYWIHLEFYLDGSTRNICNGLIYIKIILMQCNLINQFANTSVQSWSIYLLNLQMWYIGRYSLLVLCMSHPDV